MSQVEGGDVAYVSYEFTGFSRFCSGFKNEATDEMSQVWTSQMSQVSRLVQCKLCAFDMGRMVRFEQHRLLTHSSDPLIGKRRRRKKTACPFDRRQVACDRIGDLKAWCE